MILIFIYIMFKHKTLLLQSYNNAFCVYVLLNFDL